MFIYFSNMFKKTYFSPQSSILRKALGRSLMMSPAMRLSFPQSLAAKSPASPCRYIPILQAEGAS